MEICLKHNPFNVLTQHIIDLREKDLLENLKEEKFKIRGSSNSNSNEYIV